MSQEVHSEPLLLLTLFDQSTPSWIKVRGWVVGGGSPWDFSVRQSLLVLTLGLWTLDLKPIFSLDSIVDYKLLQVGWTNLLT